MRIAFSAMRGFSGGVSGGRPNGSDAHPTARLQMGAVERRDGCRD
jgi:hypothetical protein